MKNIENLHKLTVRQLENIERYLKIATNVSEFSRAKRKQVGCVIVNPKGHIVGTGYNGTPSGCDNSCEVDNVTKPEVIHAELNAIFNATTENLEGSILYLTYSPCVGCASAILQKKFKAVIYIEPYRDLSGVYFLQNNGIIVYSIDEIINAKEAKLELFETE
jgi:dCMP deaminase